MEGVERGVGGGYCMIFLSFTDLDLVDAIICDLKVIFWTP